ncbi:hypothetical protein [Hydrogenophaga sp. 2FB]|uniref:hypothetical protein n=1 Tax=Hydrogenophaga sp. 2FB TaxID=2502187 RepID=UPI0010F45D69|nr:hypothetical protein [Hydrogenophaga sp. 2FB]
MEDDLSFLLTTPLAEAVDVNPFPEGSEAHATITFWLTEAQRHELNHEGIPVALAASLAAADRAAVAAALARPSDFVLICEHVRAQAEAEAPQPLVLRELTAEEQAALERRRQALEDKKRGLA